VKRTEYLIVGGGVAGTTAADTLRAQDADAGIHIVSAEPYRFYSRIMLSKPEFFLGKIPLDSVFLKTESWARENGIAYTLGQPVAALDAGRKVARLKDGEEIGYSKLLLALGCEARRWDVPGADKRGVMHLRTLDDAREIIAAVKQAKRAVVIGGGFIGFEMCDMLKLAGLDTTLIIRENYFWEPLLEEASGRMIESALKKGGVRIVYRSLVKEVLGEERVTGVRLASGETIPADMVVVGIGTATPVGWVRRAGIACNTGILTNEYLETNVRGVWAAGDVAEYKDVILNENIQLGNWVNAHLHGKVAALNMLGKRQPFHQVSFYTAQGLGITIAFVGDVRMLPGREALHRGSPEARAYTRIIVLDGEVEGATMINRTTDLAPLTKIIERNLKIEPFRSRLEDPAFDLRNLVAKQP
jgi:NAD(P)H-nitrite reductase large subunit